jgi:hypothetical protein
MATPEEHTRVSGDAPVPPPGEPIHLPGPAYLPVLVALGVTIMLVGVIFNYVVCGLGVLITVVCVARWIGQTRTEMAELPISHE